MKIGIGIDTGGTYTDAVVYDFEKSEILYGAKELTTKDDLSIGIGNVLDGLPIDIVKKAELISLSTTLATNACIENKGGRAKLVFIGVDKRTVEEVGKEYGLPNVEDIFFLDSKIQTSGEIVEEPNFSLLEQYCDKIEAEADGIGVVQIYAMHNNAVLEKKAKSIITSKLKSQVICGHELFSDLNSIKRGSSALLNARLIPIIKEFLESIKSALKERNISVPVVIVRSDGTLMSENFTSVRPIETLLCGPAASVMGGLKLTGEKDSVVVDMGGTTTDIAIIKNGIPIKAKDGISVGNWKTFVKGLYIDTFGLGGDSALRCKNNKLVLGTNRIIPISILASKYPSVTQKLKELVENEKIINDNLHEFFVLAKNTHNNSKYNEFERAFIKVLSNGPLIISEAAKAVNRDRYTLKVDRLEKEGVVIRCGLTPTDIMHIKGDFNKYNVEAAGLAAKYVANCLELDLETLCNTVYNEVKRKLYCNISRILLEDSNSYYRTKGLGETLELFINESFDKANELKGSKFINLSITTSASLVGIGGPIHVFLPEVAKLLGTKCVIPKYAEVANALGAVVGNISASHTIEIKPDYSPSGIDGYFIYGKDENSYVKELEDAIVLAKVEAENLAIEEAKMRGAIGKISVSTEVLTHDSNANDGIVYLGTNIVSTAVGRIGL